MTHINSQKPLVCVFMITYNHERYIEQAVRSVMMQETDFPYELVIGEDCSTDRTRDIVLRLREEFPAKIRLLLPEENLGMAGNFAAVYKACDARYIALLEGDDYWVDPRKLQKQVDFMETNSFCRLCSHSANVIDENGDIHKIQGWEEIQALDAEGFLKTLLERSDHIITGSVVFRSVPSDLPLWFLELKASIDWAFFLWLLTFGGTVCHQDGIPMSAYRLHAGSVTSTLRQNIRVLSARKKVMNHYLWASEDAELTRKHMPQALWGYLDVRILRLYGITARLAFRTDPTVFREVYQKLCRLSPGGRYIPDSPRHFALVSRLFGYPFAERSSDVYQKLIPLWLRAKFNKSS